MFKLCSILCTQRSRLFQTVNVAQGRYGRAPNVCAFYGRAACKSLVIFNPIDELNDEKVKQKKFFFWEPMWRVSVFVCLAPNRRTFASWTWGLARLCPCPSAPSKPAFATTIRSSSSTRVRAILPEWPNWSGPSSEPVWLPRAPSNNPADLTPATCGRPAQVSELTLWTICGCRCLAEGPSPQVL